MHTCNLLSASTRNSLTVESLLACERKSPRTFRFSALLFGSASSRPFSLLIIPYLHLALSHILSLLPLPIVSLFLSYSTYIIRTTRRQSVQRHRCQRLVYLAPSFPLLPFFPLSFVVSFSPLPPCFCLVFLLSLTVSRYHILQDQRLFQSFYLNILIRAHVSALLRNPSLSFLRKEEKKCREKSCVVRYRVTVTVCSCLRCDNDKSPLPRL